MGEGRCRKSRASDTQAIVTCHRSAPCCAGHGPSLAFGKANIGTDALVSRTACLLLVEVEMRAVIAMQRLYLSGIFLVYIAISDFRGEVATKLELR